MADASQSKPEVILTYAVGVFALAVLVWVIAAFMRAELLLAWKDGAFWKGGAFVAAFWAAELLRRRRRKPRQSGLPD